MVNFLFDFFRIGNEAWPNAPSLEDWCMILKILDLIDLKIKNKNNDGDDDLKKKNE